MYETVSDGEMYVAIDEGVMIKTGGEVRVSARNAVGGKDLEKLQMTVEQQFLEQDTEERELRSVLTKIESGFLLRLRKLHEE